MAAGNQEWVFVSRPQPAGMALSDWELRDCAEPTPIKGEELLCATYLCSIDPTMRNAMAGPEAVALTKQTDVGYYDAMDWVVGSTPTWSVVAAVMDPNGCSGFAAGDLVQTAAPWRRYNAISARTVRKLDSVVPAEAYLGTLGGTGNAGYLPVVHIGKPQQGEVAFVSGAAGATGLVAAQSLKLLGCDVVGSAGSNDKVALLESLGIRAFNYKTEDTLAALQRLCPGGIDIYFDNVGGPTLESALEVMKDFGRIIACGQISQYDLPPEKKYGVRNLFHVVAKRLTFQGYVTDPRSFTREQFAEAATTLRQWLASGELVDQTTVIDGFSSIPAAILGLFSGANTGKMLVRAELPRALAATMQIAKM